MKKLLLFTLVFFFIAITSCTRDEEIPEVSQEEKEHLVEKVLVEFNKSAIKTGKYQEFINSAVQKTTSSSFNRSELEVMVENFFGDQTQSFLDAYDRLEALNLTSEEFHQIAHRFEYLRIYVGSNKALGCCEIGDYLDDKGGDLFDFVCGCD